MAEDQADYTISVSNPAAGNAPKINTSTPIEGQQGAIIGDVHQAGTVQPDDVSQTRQVVAPDQLPLEYQYDEEQINKTMALAVQSDIQDHTEEELIKDPTFSYASKKMFRMQRGEDFTGSDEEANQYGIDLMRSVDNNLISLGDFTAEVSNMSQEDAMTALYMMDMFEAKNFTGKGIAEAFGYMAIDPTTYAGLATFGWAFAGKEAAKVGAKASMRKVLQNKIFSATGAATVEGGLYGSGFEHMKQKVNEYGGEEYSGSDVAVVGVAGAVLSGTAAKYLPKAFEWGGEKAQKMWQKYGAKRTPKAGISAGEGMNTEAIPTELVKAAAGGDTEAAKALTSAVFERNFQRIIDHNTGDQLKPMLLQKLKDNPDLIEQLAKKYNYEFKYFSHNPDSVGKKIGDGVVEAPPKSKQQLTKKGYNDGKVWVYDPLDTHGAFDDAEYTKAWRQVHELAHAITEHFMQEKYGDSRRFGALGFDIKNPYDAEDPRTYKGLNLSEAQRAIEWEDVAFRTQVELLKDLGIPVNEKEALDDWNIAGSDTLVRVLTGDFSDPAQHGVITDGMSEKIKTKDVLQVLENQEHLMAHEEGRSPTLGTDLHEWQQVTDEALKENIGNFTKRGKADTVNISVESITGEASLNPEFKKHLDANPDLKAEYHKEIEPIVDEIFADSGLDVVKKTDTSGLWKDGVNPSTQYEVKIPKGGTTPEFQQQIEKTAMELAEVLEQDGVGYNVVTPREHKADGSLAEDANGFVLSGGKQLEDADLIKFNDLLLEKYPDGNIALVTTADGVKVFDWTEKPVKASDLIKTVDDIMHNLSLKYNIDQADINGQVAMPDWKGIANGTKSTKTKNTTGADRQASSGISGSGRQNDVQGQDLRSRVKAIQEKYSNKVSPKDKLRLPSPTQSKGGADGVIAAASKLQGKAKQKALQAAMRDASPEDKQKLIAEMKQSTPAKQSKPKTPKVQKIIKEREQFNSHFYSKLEHEINNIPEDQKFKSPTAALDALKKAGVKQDEIEASGITEFLDQYSSTYVTGGTLQDIINQRITRPDKISKRIYTEEDFDSGASSIDRDSYEFDYTTREDGVEVSVGEAGYGTTIYDENTGVSGEIGLTYDYDRYQEVGVDGGEVYDFDEAKEAYLKYDAGDYLDDAAEELKLDIDDPAVLDLAWEKAEDDGHFHEKYDYQQLWETEDGESFDELEEAAQHLYDNMYHDFSNDTYNERGNSFKNYTVDGADDDYWVEIYQMEDFEVPAGSNKLTHQEPHFGEDYQNSMEYGNDNIQAHVRYKQRTDAEGKNGDVAEELQAQWEQDWRSKGADAKPATDEEKATAQATIDDLNKENHGYVSEAAALRSEIKTLEKEMNDKLVSEVATKDQDVLRSELQPMQDRIDAAKEELSQNHAARTSVRERMEQPLAVVNSSENRLAAPPIKNRTQYEKIVLLDGIFDGIENGKDFYGWINGHIQNGGNIETTVGMSQSYDIEMPRIIQKATGETPYMMDFKTGKPILSSDGEKIMWDGKKMASPKGADEAEIKANLEYFDNLHDDQWYWRIDFTDKMKARLKDAKIEMYGVGGAALVGANGVSLEGDDDGTK